MQRMVLASMTALIVTVPVWAQQTTESGATGPRWETRATDMGARLLSGTETFRVGKDARAASRPTGTYFAIRVIRTKETIPCDKLPYTFRWDTTKAPEGWHWLELVMIDGNGVQPDQVIDSLKVYVRNDSATPPPPPATPVTNTDTTPNTPVPVAAPPSSTPPAPREGTRVALSSRRRDPRARGTRLPRMVALPEMAPSNRIDAAIADSDNPLTVPRATALCKSDQKLYVGLPDGGVAIWDEERKRGQVVRLTTLTGPVRALAAGDGAVYWTAGNTDTVYCYREKEKTITAFDAAEQPLSSDSLEEEAPGSGRRGGPRVDDSSSASDRTATWIERLAVLGKRVALMGASATRFLEPDGTLKTVADELPSSISENYSDSLVQCYIGTTGGVRNALLLLASPDVSGQGGSLRLWSGNTVNLHDGWQERGTLATSAPLIGSEAKKTAPVLTPFGFAVPEKVSGSRPTGVEFAALTDKDSPANPITIPLGVTGDYNVNAPQSADMISCGGSGVWWSQNGIVFHADPFNGKRECYVPWNGAGATVTALLADKDGAYAATDKGVRRLVLGSPTDEDGYGGYVRVPLGDEYAVPPTDRDRQLAASIEAWQGVPYKWGGQKKTGTDCSGFVGAMHQAVGVTLPRTSTEMGETRQGKRVRDELHYGDTLVFPGHVALYIGNGRTAETVGGTGTGAVGKASIWRRRDVIVKRFLP